MSTYTVQFRARVAEHLPDDAAARLAQALADLPGARAVGDPGIEGDILSGAFAIGVTSGRMADAARDGGRLAKESLNSAGIDGQLVELAVKLDDA